MLTNPDFIINKGKNKKSMIKTVDGKPCEQSLKFYQANCTGIHRVSVQLTILISNKKGLLTGLLSVAKGGIEPPTFGL
jgi:hypothetical protein